MLSVDRNKIREALDGLADEIKAEIKKRMASSDAVNRKSGENLVGTDLFNSVEVNVVGSEELAFSIADYYEFVVSGWRPTGRFPGTFGQFFSNIEKWIRKKGIPLNGKTENQLAWAIINGIYKNGIAARPFINSGYNNNEDPSKILAFLDTYVENTMDLIFDVLAEHLDDEF